MSFKIGNVEIKGRILLAPMAGYTNEAFFYVCKKYGASLLSSEMISDKGLIYSNDKTINLTKFDDSLHPFSIQLFGSDKDSLRDAAKILVEKAHPDIIDINMGCSVPKVYKNGSGSALLKTPDKIGEIVKELSTNIGVPITIKIRSGINHKTLNYLEVGKIAEENGASAIIFHPRTKSDLFSGKADWNQIKELKEHLSIPVIGSGDIKTPMDAKRMLDETGCDAVMIGRAALGNPFIFKEINEYLEKGFYTPVSFEEKFETLLEHYNHLVERKGERIATLEARSFASFYVKGMPNATYFKSALNKIATKEEFYKLFNDFKDEVL